MTNSPNSSGEKLKQILVIFATLGMVTINWMAGRGYVGGVTTGEISDKYPTFITPAGYAFSIWGLIYLGLIAFSLYQALPSKGDDFKKIRSLYILSCAANCAWIYFWHYEIILGSLAVIFVLLGTLLFINLNLKGNDSTAETALARAPFALYFGWVTVAAILNFTIALAYLGVRASETVAIILACILVTTAAVLGVLIRPIISNSAYPLAIAWAFTAIAVKQSGKTALIVFCAFGVAALLLSALSFVLKDKQK